MKYVCVALKVAYPLDKSLKKYISINCPAINHYFVKTKSSLPNLICIYSIQNVYAKTIDGLNDCT